MAKITLCVLSIILALALPALASEPRYLIFNRAPWQSGEDWWDQNAPDSINAQKLRQVIDGLDAPDNPDLRIGVSFVFSILDSATETLQKDLRNLTEASSETGIPIMLLLDGSAWWGTRPDLWNWWDPNQSGYDPLNVNNVEWTGWSPESAVKIGWRNWGHQFRVRPCPNLMSPVLLRETRSRLSALVPIVADWYDNLPENRRYLFAGLKIGWEVGIGYNHWYYPDGNHYLEEWPDDSSHDPQTGLQIDKGWPCGMPKLGYAAVKTAGIRKSGKLTVADVAEVIQRYLATLCESVSALGIPRDRLFSHMGGNYPPWDKHFPFTPALNEWSRPAYSFYGHYPDEAGDLGKVLDEADQPIWGIAEWYHGAPDAAGWRTNLSRAIRFRDCRFINVYNWEEFRKHPEALEGTRLLIEDWNRPSSSDVNPAGP